VIQLNRELVDYLEAMEVRMTRKMSEFSAEILKAIDEMKRDNSSTHNEFAAIRETLECVAGKVLLQEKRLDIHRNQLARIEENLESNLMRDM
jgi:predicted  nucleic acid-binding Zn-ribbon protein